MRGLKALLAVPVLTAGLVVVMPVAQAGAATDIVAACPTTGPGTTITLTGNCDTTETLMVPDGATLNGGGFTITAHDPPGGVFKGAVVMNARHLDAPDQPEGARSGIRR